MHQLLEMMSQGTHSAITAWIWGFSLILQLTLFIALFTRRVSAAFPFFTNLIGFYLIRSILLYVAFDYFSGEAYSGIYNFLLLLDILVQMGMVVELTRSLAVEAGGSGPIRIIYISGGILLASLGTWVLMLLMPKASIPLDRSQIFFSIIGVLLLIASFRSSNHLLRTIAQGWGVFSLISFAAGIGRVFAAAGNHPRGYAAWSYALACGYLVTVAFWLVALRTPSGTRIVRSPQDA